MGGGAAAASASSTVNWRSLLKASRTAAIVGFLSSTLSFFSSTARMASRSSSLERSANIDVVTRAGMLVTAKPSTVSG